MMIVWCLQPDKLVECFQYFLQGLGLGTYCSDFTCSVNVGDR